MRTVVTVKPWEDLDARLDVILGAGIRNLRINFARSGPDRNMKVLSVLGALLAAHRLDAVFADLPTATPKLLAIPERKRFVEPGAVVTIVRADEATPDRPFAMSSLAFAALGSLDVGEPIVIADGTGVVVAHDASIGELTVEMRSAAKIHGECSVTALDPGAAAPDPEPLRALLRHSAASALRYVCVTCDSPATAKLHRSSAATVAGITLVARLDSQAAVLDAAPIGRLVDGLLLPCGDSTRLRLGFDPFTVAGKVIDAARNTSGVSILANGFFPSVARTGDLDATDRRRLQRARELDPDFLFVNETSSSLLWREVIEAAAAWEA